LVAVCILILFCCWSWVSCDLACAD